MEDLSHLFAGGPISALTPSSQHGGNQVFDNHAMTAPGSASGDLGDGAGAAVVADAPAIAADDHVSPVLLDQGGAAVHPDHADRSAPFAGDSGGGWAGRPVIVRGGWNDLGGGPAPEGR